MDRSNMRNSQYLKCPLTPNFFRKLGKIHSSQIRRALLSAWGLSSKEYVQVIRARLNKFGWLESTTERTVEWIDAFKFSKARNKYDGYNRDRSRMNEEVAIGNILVYKGVITIDEPTWLTVASLAFQKDVAKESPNHFFLKELLGLFMYRESIDFIAEEKVSDIYGHLVRYDMVFSYPIETLDTSNLLFPSNLSYPSDTNDSICIAVPSDTIESIDKVTPLDTVDTVNSIEPKDVKEQGMQYIIGEVGDTELWKVMGTVYQGNQCIILPHWTWQRINPFITKKIQYQYYLLRGKGSGIK